MKKVATRFAPSPTGPLHIGGVRTALFNWLYAKNQKGNFYLRIEDTDKERSKEEYKQQIIESLNWIGVNHDGEEYVQSKKIEDHIKVANELLKNGFAYKCYCSNEEIICFLNSSFDLSLSVSSILKKYLPLFFFAKSQLNKAVRTPPI